MSADDRRAALERGARAERAVADDLSTSGWTILHRNWRGGGGELDLVVERAGEVRFVEVKLRAPDDPTLADAVTASKQRRLIGAARAWLLQYEPPAECAFLVALVRPHAGGWQIAYIDNAFDAG